MFDDNNNRVSRYRLGEKLGEGGIAEVFHATMTGAEGFSMAVAIKRLSPELSSLPRYSYMLAKEARLGAQLAHPNLVRVLDLAWDAEGRLCLVMEFVDGMDLARLMASGPLPLSVAVFVIGEILAGLAYAHELPASSQVRGILHRDVSPQNVLLSWEGAVKVSDFGLARPRDDDAHPLGRPLDGKPAYMSPEQLKGGRMDCRSDLFAVGVVFWEIPHR